MYYYEEALRASNTPNNAQITQQKLGVAFSYLDRRNAIQQKRQENYNKVFIKFNLQSMQPTKEL